MVDRPGSLGTLGPEWLGETMSAKSQRAAVAASAVTLREVTRDTVRDVCALSVADEQKGFVASNAQSIAEASFSDEAWFRAIYAGEELVGFVMLFIDPEKPRYFLWRLMIDARHQGHGYGREAMGRVLAFVRTLPNARVLETSYCPGPGCPKGFYEKLGFRETGEERHGQHLMTLDLVDPDRPKNKS